MHPAPVASPRLHELLSHIGSRLQLQSRLGRPVNNSSGNNACLDCSKKLPAAARQALTAHRHCSQLQHRLGLLADNSPHISKCKCFMPAAYPNGARLDAKASIHDPPLDLKAEAQD
eukprot:1039428-Pelagomonas_calceolata.AAC.4